MAEQPKSYEKVLTYLEDSLRRGQLSLVGIPCLRSGRLAEQLGISRNSVREAVRLLEHMGFIVSKPRGPAILSAATSSAICRTPLTC